MMSAPAMTQPLASLSFGDFRIDVPNRLLFREGQPVALTPKAFETLFVLVKNRGNVLSKEELLDRVWPDSFVTEATLSQNIYLLRKVLEGQSSKRWIQTMPRRGYRFDGEVEEREPVPTPGPAPLNPLPLASARSHDPSSAPAPPRTLAVLPFRSLPDDEDGRFLGLGMTDAMITSLSNMRQLTVRATSAILRYVDRRDLDSVSVGRELGVEGVLEGSIQRWGDQLRITVQLISVAEGVLLWADSFTGANDELFVAQDSIARDLVSRLRLRLTRQEESILQRRPTQNLEAHRLHIRGRYMWNRRTAADLQKAIELFRRAISLDPTYSRAYSGLADALILLPFYGAARPVDAFHQAREAARRALELEEESAEAHTSLAYTEFVYSRDWQAAEKGFRRAMELAPRYPTTSHWYAFFLTALGRHDEAIDIALRAQSLDPLSLVISSDLALVTYFARRYEESLDLFRGVIEVAPDFGYAHFGLTMCQSELGQHGEAIASGREALELLASDSARAALGYSLAKAGEKSEAGKILAEMGQLSHGGASYRALVLAALGEKNEALEALEIGLEDRSRFGVFLGVWPAFDSLRGEPRFDALLECHGLGTEAANDPGP